MRSTKLMAALAAMVAVSACVTGSNDGKKPVSSPATIKDFRAYVAEVCPNDPKKDAAFVAAKLEEMRTLAALYVEVQKNRLAATQTAEGLYFQRRNAPTGLGTRIAAAEAEIKSADDKSAIIIEYMRAIDAQKIDDEIDKIQASAETIELDFAVLRDRIARRNAFQATVENLATTPPARSLAVTARDAEDGQIRTNLQTTQTDIAALESALRAGGIKAAAIPIGAAIAAAVLPSLIDAALDLVAGALHEAAKDKSLVHTATTTAYLHTAPKPENTGTAPFLANTPKLDCIILAKGEFAGAMPDAASGDIYIEARVERSNDRAAFRLVPVYARLNNYENTGAFGGGTPEIAVSVALNAARAGKESAPVALTMFALPIVEARNELKLAQLQGRESYWTTYPAPDAAAKARLERLAALHKRVVEAASIIDDPNCKAEPSKLWSNISDLGAWILKEFKDCPEAQESLFRAVLETQAKKDTTADAANFAAAAVIADLKKRAIAAKEIAEELEKREKAYLGAFASEIKLTPVSIEVLLIESRKGSPFLQAVANALDKSKKDISTALVQELSPVERAKRRAEEEQQTRTNRAAVATAEDNVRLKQAELDDLPATATRAERVRAENALRQAKIAANNAYLADGRGVPYPEAQP